MNFYYKLSRVDTTPDNIDIKVWVETDATHLGKRHYRVYTEPNGLDVTMMMDNTELALIEAYIDNLTDSKISKEN